MDQTQRDNVRIWIHRFSCLGSLMDEHPEIWSNIVMHSRNNMQIEIKCGRDEILDIFQNFEMIMVGYFGEKCGHLKLPYYIRKDDATDGPIYATEIASSELRHVISMAFESK